LLITNKSLLLNPVTHFLLEH